MSNINSGKALKSGIWYVFANFITKGMVFISTPIFARMLTKEEYGLYSNYTSWLAVCTIVISMDLHASFASAKFDYKDEFDSYISSTACLSIIFSGVGLVIVNALGNPFVQLTGIRIEHLNVMLIYMMFTNIVDIFQARERFRFEYKKSFALSLVISIGGTLLSVFLVYYLPDRLSGRIVGSSLVNIVVGLLLFIFILYKGKTVKISHWKYALPICLPYIPHLLSLTVLNSVDRIMITNICGAEFTALYTIAYSCGHIVSLLIKSMNTAFSPWLGEQLNEEKYNKIKKFSKYYIMLFSFLACGLMLISPEVLYIMGGKSYLSAVYILPPVSFGFVCQFLYTMFVNVEQFKKNTLWMALASAAAAFLNYFLNYLFIPRFGYIAAAYTTLIGFVFLLASHMFIVYRMGLLHVYDIRTLLKSVGVVACFTVGVNFLIDNNIIRYAVIVVYIIILIVIMKKYYKPVMAVLKRK